LKITDFRTRVLGTPWRNLSYLWLETDANLTGIGESRVVCKTHTVLEYLRDVRRHIIGHDPFDIEDLYRRLTLLDFGKPGEIVMTGLAMVEMACWDLIGKSCRQPVYKLLGGRVRDSIPAYANGWYTVERSPEAFAEAARRVTAKGYRGLKFDPFGNGDLELERREFHRSIDLIAAVHDAVGRDAQLFIEMHGRFAPHQAVEIARAIERYAPAWIEEPCRPGNLQGLAAVRRGTSLPIATGERLYGAQEFAPLFALGVVDIIQPDITQCGGILEVKKIASTAETHGIVVAPHNVGGAVSTMAVVHLAATLRNAKVIEHFNDFVDLEVKQAAAPYPEVRDGRFSLPTGPGLGIEVDEEFIRAHPPRTEGGVILDPGLDMFRDASWNMRGSGAR
jgi:galactonate dehydratase